MGVTELRPRRGPRTAFVLGGGGNLGAVQVGMLRALFERGMTPDWVIGCSVRRRERRRHRPRARARRRRDAREGLARPGDLVGVRQPA